MRLLLLSLLSSSLCVASASARSSSDALLPPAASTAACFPSAAEASVSSDSQACSGHGICRDHDSDGASTCFCEPGFMGALCDRATCISHCNDRGHCDPSTRRCVCDGDWGGHDCSEPLCRNRCNGHGVCDRRAAAPHLLQPGVVQTAEAVVEDPAAARVCFCAPGWKGEDCGRRACAVDPSGSECGGRGVCNDGRCVCDLGWHGAACDTPTCARPCRNGGSCVCHKRDSDDQEGDTAASAGESYDCSCQCGEGFTGAACEYACPAGCSGHGSCNQFGRCVCAEGYGGRDCSRRECPMGCSDHGICGANATCSCLPGWVGAGCERLACPGHCNFRVHQGECLFDKCVCYPGYTGDACESILPSAPEAEQSAPCGENCFDRCRVNTDCAISSAQEFTFQHDAFGEVQVSVPATSGPIIDAEVDAATGRMQDSDSSRKCYLDCVNVCMDRCFEKMFALGGEERAALAKSMEHLVTDPSTGEQLVVGMGTNGTQEVTSATGSAMQQALERLQDKKREAET